MEGSGEREGKRRKRRLLVSQSVAFPSVGVRLLNQSIYDLSGFNLQEREISSY